MHAHTQERGIERTVHHPVFVGRRLAQRPELRTLHHLRLEAQGVGHAEG